MALIAKIKNTADNTDYNVRDDVHTWGGRNLLLRSNQFLTADWYRSDTTRVLFYPDEGYMKFNYYTSTRYAKCKIQNLLYENIELNTYYTYSFEAKYEDDGTGGSATTMASYLGFNLSSRTGNTFSTSYDKYQGVTTTLTTDWKKYSYTYLVPDNLTQGVATALTNGSYLTLQFGRQAAAYTFYVRNIKLEKGNKATDWSPAPEDIAYVNGTTLELLS